MDEAILHTLEYVKKNLDNYKAYGSEQKEIKENIKRLILDKENLEYDEEKIVECYKQWVKNFANNPIYMIWGAAPRKCRIFGTRMDCYFIDYGDERKSKRYYPLSEALGNSDERIKCFIKDCVKDFENEIKKLDKKNINKKNINKKKIFFCIVLCILAIAVFGILFLFNVSGVCRIIFVAGISVLFWISCKALYNFFCIGRILKKADVAKEHFQKIGNEVLQQGILNQLLVGKADIIDVDTLETQIKSPKELINKDRLGASDIFILFCLFIIIWGILVGGNTISDDMTQMGKGQARMSKIKAADLVVDNQCQLEDSDVLKIQMLEGEYKIVATNARVRPEPSFENEELTYRVHGTEVEVIKWDGNALENRWGMIEINEKGHQYGWIHQKLLELKYENAVDIQGCRAGKGRDLKEVYDKYLQSSVNLAEAHGDLVLELKETVHVSGLIIFSGDYNEDNYNKHGMISKIQILVDGEVIEERELERKYNLDGIRIPLGEGIVTNKIQLRILDIDRMGEAYISEIVVIGFGISEELASHM